MNASSRMLVHFLMCVGLLLMLLNNVQAQKFRLHAPADTNAIRSYDHMLNVGIEYGSQFTEYRTYYNDTFYLAARPNEVYTFSPFFKYRWLTLSYAFTPDFVNLNNDNNLRGETRYRRLSGSISFNQLSLHGSIASTKGFYIANMPDVDANWKPGDPYIQIPDLKVLQLQGAAVYRTNPNFSIKAIQGGEEMQLKSAWSFLPGFNFQHFQFVANNNDSVPGQVDVSNNFDVNLMLPIAGTWVFGKHAFVSGTAGPMIGVDFFNSLAVTESRSLVRANGTRMSAGFYYGVNLGYNHPKWYVGLTSYVSHYKHGSANDERLAKVFNRFTLYAGYRLKALPFMKKTMDWAEKIVPFL